MGVSLVKLYKALVRLVSGGILCPLPMSMSEDFSVSFLIWISLCYTKPLEWSSLVPGPEAKSSSEIMNLTSFTTSYHWKRLKEEEKGRTEDEMVGWHHPLDGHDFELAPEVADGQGSLACCSPWGCKELDITDLNVTKNCLCSLSFDSLFFTPPP